jgi:hypothetical protein
MPKLTRSDAVNYLNSEGVPVSYPMLNNWAQRKVGPSYTRPGRDAQYDLEELKRFVEEEKAKRAKP